MKRLIVDIDGTLTIENSNEYSDKIPNIKLVEKLNKYKKDGYEIVLFTASNMNTYNNDVDLIRKHTLPVIKEWLHKHSIPHDDIIIGKPWCGLDGFYIDDKSVRPEEFIDLSYDEIKKLIK
jgi:capsule biosynthesis phosphatase